MAGFIRKEDSPLQTERKAQRAKQQLEFAPGDILTPAEVRERFAVLAKLRHPDVAPIHADTPAYRYSLDQLRRSKNYLVKHLEKENG